MSRRKVKTLDDGAPIFTQVRHGIRVIGQSWAIDKDRESNEIWTKVRIAGYVLTDNTNAMPFGGNRACWKLRLERGKAYSTNGKYMPRSNYTVHLGYHPEGTEENAEWEKVIFRGNELRWDNAIHEVKIGAPVIDTMRLMAKEAYEKTTWTTLRPFIVQFPWTNPKEPNAKYSPFKLAGGFRLDETCDGDAVSVASTAGDRMKFATKLCKQVGANAFLARTDNGEWRVYHRGVIGYYPDPKPDPIDIDDWRARIIAGTDEEFEAGGES